MAGRTRGRPKNTSNSVGITISASTQIKLLLEVLAKQGSHGKNPAEVALTLVVRGAESLARDGIFLTAEGLRDILAKSEEFLPDKTS